MTRVPRALPVPQGRFSRPAVPPLPLGLCGTQHRARKSPGCSQTGVPSASLRDVRAGPPGRLRFPRPAAESKLPATLPAPGFTHSAAPLPSRSEALGARGRGRSRASSFSGTRGGRSEAPPTPRPSRGWEGGRRGRTPRPPGPRTCRQGPPGRPKASETRDRAAPHSPRAARPPLPQHGRGVVP